MSKKKLSIVIPALNEEANLDEVFSRVNAVAASCSDYDFEMIIIDNSSIDKTGVIAKGFAEIDERWRYIRFSRNFGFETSLAAGLKYAKGDLLVFLPSDLQDPPELIEKMLSIYEEGNSDVVYGVLNKRNDYRWLKTWGAKVAYTLIHKLSDIKVPVNATDFRLITRQVIDSMNEFSERGRYFRGLAHWVGFRQTSFQYDRVERKAGESDAHMLYCINFAISAIISFSAKPLKAASILGFFITILSGVLGVVYTALYILSGLGMNPLPTPPAGWATLVLLVLFMGGVNCLFLGILGEYIGQIFTEVKARPQWIVQEQAGFPVDKNSLKVKGSDSVNFFN